MTEPRLMSKERLDALSERLFRVGAYIGGFIDPLGGFEERDLSQMMRGDPPVCEVKLPFRFTDTNSDIFIDRDSEGRWIEWDA